MNNNSSATVMLGLEGMTVLAVSERDGELEYAIETTAATGWCSVCGAVAQLHGRRPTWVRDLPAGDRPVTLVWVKRVWRCVHRQCEQQTRTETHPAIGPRSWWTERDADIGVMRCQMTGLVPPTVPVAQESVQKNHRHIGDFGTNLSCHQGKPVGCGDGNPLCCYWVHQRGQRLIVEMPLVVPALKPQLQVMHADPEQRQ